MSIDIDDELDEFDDDNSFDEFDDMDEFDDLFSTPPPPKNAREAVSATLNSSVTNFKDEFDGNPVELAGKFIDLAMPSKLSSENGNIKEISSGITNEVNIAKTEISSVAKPLIKQIDNVIPKGGNTERVINILKEKLGMNNDEVGPLQQEEDLTAKINASVIDALGTLQDRTFYKDAFFAKMDDNKSKSILKINNIIAANIDALNSFNINVTNRYYRKSLELQFRHLYTANQQLDITKAGFDTFKNQLEAIVRNSALPDFIKTRKSELLKQTVVRKSADALFNNNTMVRKLKNKFKTDIKEAVSNVSGGLQAATDGLESASSLSEMSDMAGGPIGMLGGLISGTVLSKMGSIVGNTLGKTKVGKSFISGSKDLLMDPSEKLKAMAENRDDGIIKNSLNKVGNYLDVSGDEENSFTVDSLERKEVAVFDGDTKTSIVKVIPSLLSKILKEVTVISTKAPASALKYNFESDSFVTEDSLNKNLSSDIRESIVKSGVYNNVDTLVTRLTKDIGLKVNDKEVEELKNGILMYGLSNRPAMPTRLDKNGFYDNFDKDLSDKLKKSIEKYINDPDENIRDENVANLNNDLLSIRKNAPSPQDIIDKYNDMDAKGILLDKGLLNYDKDNKKYTLDNNSYKKMIGSAAVEEHRLNKEKNKQETVKKKPIITDVKKLSKESSFSKTTITGVKDTIGKTTKNKINNEMSDKTTSLYSSLKKYKNDLANKSANKIKLLIKEFTKESREELTKVSKFVEKKPVIQKEVKVEITKINSEIDKLETIKVINKAYITRSMSKITTSISKLVSKLTTKETKENVNHVPYDEDKVSKETLVDIVNSTNPIQTFKDKIRNIFTTGITGKATGLAGSFLKSITKIVKKDLARGKKLRSFLMKTGKVLKKPTKMAAKATGSIIKAPFSIAGSIVKAPFKTASAVGNMFSKKSKDGTDDTKPKENIVKRTIRSDLDNGKKLRSVLNKLYTFMSGKKDSKKDTSKIKKTSSKKKQEVPIDIVKKPSGHWYDNLVKATRSMSEAMNGNFGDAFATSTTLSTKDKDINKDIKVPKRNNFKLFSKALSDKTKNFKSNFLKHSDNVDTTKKGFSFNGSKTLDSVKDVLTDIKNVTIQNLESVTGVKYNEHNRKNSWRSKLVKKKETPLYPKEHKNNDKLIVKTLSEIKDFLIKPKSYGLLKLAIGAAIGGALYYLDDIKKGIGSVISSIKSVVSVVKSVGNFIGKGIRSIRNAFSAIGIGDKVPDEAPTDKDGNFLKKNKAGKFVTSKDVPISKNDKGEFVNDKGEVFPIKVINGIKVPIGKDGKPLVSDGKGGYVTTIEKEVKENPDGSYVDAEGNVLNLKTTDVIDTSVSDMDVAKYTVGTAVAGYAGKKTYNFYDKHFGEGKVASNIDKATNLEDALNRQREIDKLRGKSSSRKANKLEKQLSKLNAKVYKKTGGVKPTVDVPTSSTTVNKTMGTVEPKTSIPKSKPGFFSRAWTSTKSHIGNAWNATKKVFNIAWNKVKVVGGKILNMPIEAAKSYIAKATVKIKALGSKIIKFFRPLKRAIIKIGGKSTAKLLGKLAARTIPVLGWALVLYDATMIAKDMYKNDITFASAVSKQILGIDLPALYKEYFTDENIETAKVTATTVATTAAVAKVHKSISKKPKVKLTKVTPATEVIKKASLKIKNTKPISNNIDYGPKDNVSKKYINNEQYKPKKGFIDTVKSYGNKALSEADEIGKYALKATGIAAVMQTDTVKNTMSSIGSNFNKLTSLDVINKSIETARASISSRMLMSARLLSNKLYGLIAGLEAIVITKYGPSKSFKILKLLSKKLASRVIPGILLLDAIMIVKDMYENGTKLMPAISNRILGIDVTAKKDLAAIEEDIKTTEKIVALDKKSDTKEEKSKTFLDNMKNTMADTFSYIKSNVSEQYSRGSSAISKYTKIDDEISDDAEDTVLDKIKDLTSKVVTYATGTINKVKMATGNLFSSANGKNNLAYKNDESIDGFNVSMREKLLAMANEYNSLTGKKIPINSGYRSYKEQVRLKKKYGSRAATPGKSTHEFGLAFDTNTTVANELDNLGLMRKYGFTRPVGGETWHVEPAGIQFDLNKSKKNPEVASKLIDSYVGLGGDGWGTKNNSKKYSRNKEYQLAIAETKAEPSKLEQTLDTAMASMDNMPNSLKGIYTDVKDKTSNMISGISSTVNKTTMASIANKFNEYANTEDVENKISTGFNNIKSSVNNVIANNADYINTNKYSKTVDSIVDSTSTTLAKTKTTADALYKTYGEDLTTMLDKAKKEYGENTAEYKEYTNKLIANAMGTADDAYTKVSGMFNTESIRDNYSKYITKGEKFLTDTASNINTNYIVPMTDAVGDIDKLSKVKDTIVKNVEERVAAATKYAKDQTKILDGTHKTLNTSLDVQTAMLESMNTLIAINQDLLNNNLTLSNVSEKDIKKHDYTKGNKDIRVEPFNNPSISVKRRNYNS